MNKNGYVARLAIVGCQQVTSVECQHVAQSLVHLLTNLYMLGSIDCFEETHMSEFLGECLPRLAINLRPHNSTQLY